MTEQGRSISYLRLSVTDRCNLRCIYCMPQEGIRILPQRDILTYDELVEIIATVAGPLGLKGIRITGGEPLVRGGILDLVRRLSAMGVIEDLSLTTNALLLTKMAGPLREAGLRRVNISLDTLRPDRYRRICRGGSLEKVMAGIDAAVEAGLAPVKINQVVIPGVNDDEVEQMARLTVDREQESFGLRSADGPRGLGPARYYRIPGAKGNIGFISPLSRHFCSSCNRIRLTADGWIRTCLLSDRVGVDVKTPFRAGERGDVLVDIFREAIRRKPASHDLAPKGNGGNFIRTMCQIGG
jgi:cyclic pyranopterin phosphate synthase